MLPCGEGTKNARSIICLYYGNIIWLPWQRPLTNCNVKRFYIRRNTPNHDVNTQRNFDWAVLRRNYWTDLHQNFTRYSGISGTIKSYIYTALFYTVSECQSDEVRSLPFFTKSVAMATSLEIAKKRSRSIICTQNVFIWWKDCENWSSGSWDNLSTRNH